MGDRSAKIVMFHVGRSGSTVVADLLGQTTGVVWDGELYERFGRDGETPDGVSRYARIDFRALIRQRLEASSAELYGIEVKFFQLRAAGQTTATFLEHADALGFDRFVVLRRRNVLRKVVSSAVAHRTGTYHVAAGETATRRRIRLDPEHVAIDGAVSRLVDLLAGYERDFAELSRCLDRRQALWLTYEDDVAADPRAAYRRICAFAGIRPEPVVPRFVRTTPFDLRDVLIDYDDVQKALRGTDFAWMLEDGR